MARTITVGEVVTLYDGARVRVTSVEDDIKNGYPGGEGITVNDPGRRAREGRSAAEPDRWFYIEDVR